MSLSIIAAMDKNRLIGDDNEIPWDLPADLKYFKQTTMGAPVIMGRKTFESIGFPLPGRRNIILTRAKNYTAEGCEVVNSYKNILNEFLDSKEEAFIIGGAEIYKLFLNYANKLYLTIIEEEFSGDTYFPKLNFDNWLQINKLEGEYNSQNPYKYNYYIYQRKNKISRSEK